MEKKKNKKRVNKWIDDFLVRYEAEWKKWRRIFTGLASIWRNARARQIQKANPKGMHLSYNNIDRSIFDQKDNNIEAGYALRLSGSILNALLINYVSGFAR